MVNAQKITANTSFFMFSLVLQKILSLVYFTILARTLGAESVGQYFFAISFATMFSVFIDLGLSPVLIREVAKDQARGESWFKQIFTLKIILALLTAGGLFILDQILFYDDAVKNLIYISGLIVIVDSFSVFFYAYIRGRQSLKYESLATILFQILVLITGLLALRWTDNVAIFLLVLLLASLFNFIFACAVLQLKFKIFFTLLWDRIHIKEIINISWPFALSAIFAKIYAYVDTFFLKIFLGDSQVGHYSVAYKITFAFQFIPLAFVAALYPAFSHYFRQSQTDLAQTFFKSFHYLFFISLPLAAGIIALAPEIIGQLYTSEYGLAVRPLQILIASLPFLFTNFALSSLLNASNRQIINTRNLGYTMLLNIVLNLFLIPSQGVWGASLASTISTIFLLSLNFMAVSRVLKFSGTEFKPLLGSLLSVLIMLLGVLYFKIIWPWYAVAVGGFLVYSIMMFLTGTLSKQDLIYVRQSLIKMQ